MTPEERTLHVVEATSNLEWCIDPGHSLDHAVQMAIELDYADHEARVAKARSDAIYAGTAGLGTRPGHSDPTASALGRPSGARPTPANVVTIDAAAHAIHDSAITLDHLVADVLGVDRWSSVYDPSRRGLVSNTLAHIRPPHQINEAAGRVAGSELAAIDWLVRDELHAASDVLRARAETVLGRAPGAVPAVQRTIIECGVCSPWRSGTLATSNGRCTQCSSFRRNHGCDPTEPIVRRWDYGKAATPSQIVEAKAAARTVSKSKHRKAS